MAALQRLPAETALSDELELLKNHDKGDKPEGWQLSPSSVRDFILGTELDGQKIAKKIFGNDDVVEKAIVTLIGQRGLLLVGEPGTAKSMLSELLAAAISGNSKITVQGSAGIVEENIRYSWNYAMLLKHGPSLDALIPGPLYEGMNKGQLMRFEEITRCPTEIQDNLIPVMSDKILHVPELKDENDSYILAKAGFNIIATANLKDRGVNEMSSALKRRFNFITMQALRDIHAQSELIKNEVNKQLQASKINITINQDIAEVLATAFHELREGAVEGSVIDKPKTVMSMAEAISVAYSAAIQCHYFNQSEVSPSDLASHMLGTVIKDDEEDAVRFNAYLRLVAHKRKDDRWQNFSQAR